MEEATESQHKTTRVLPHIEVLHEKETYRNTEKFQTQERTDRTKLLNYECIL